MGNGVEVYSGATRAQELQDDRDEKMIESFVRPESWINEVLRINLLIGGINEFEFGYSQLSAIAS